MIKRTFICAAGHTTKPWVEASDDLEAKKNKGELECGKTMDDGSPCGALIVEIPLAAPNVNSGTSRPSRHNNISPAQMKAALIELRRHVEANADYVGERFAEEARKIHYGEADPHAIYGEASEQESRELASEGIAHGRIPWVKLEN